MYIILRNVSKLVIPCFCIAMLSGCIKMGSDYKKSDMDIADNWNVIERSGDDNPILIKETLATDIKWWKKFNDDRLSDLIEKSLLYNNDIKSAEARIKEAVASNKTVFSSFLPQINGTGSVTRERLGASSGNGLDNSSEIGVDGSWNLDVFGGNKRKREAAIADIEKTEAERDSVKLSIISEVARNYIKLRQSQAQKHLVLENITIQMETLKGTEVKRKLGTVTDLEIARAEAQIESAKERLLQINTDGFIALNRLHVLTGESPDKLWELILETTEIPVANDEIVAETPLSVIAKHPDVRAAERNLASSAALTGAAFSDLFPKITLSGFFGVQESNLFGTATPWSAAGNLLMPVLNFGKLRSLVKQADARQEQSFFEYKQTVLLTLEAVENSFITYKNDRKRMDRLSVVLEKRQKVVDIAKEQYKAGVINQLDLLVAQEDKLNAENNLAIRQAQVAENIVSLYKALGMLGNTEQKPNL